MGLRRGIKNSKNMISEQINFLENDLVKGTLKAALQKAFEGREGELIKLAILPW